MAVFGIFSGPYFPTFRVNTERYSVSVSLPVQYLSLFIIEQNFSQCKLPKLYFLLVILSPKFHKYPVMISSPKIQFRCFNSKTLELFNKSSVVDFTIDEILTELGNESVIHNGKFPRKKEDCQGLSTIKHLT